MFDNLPKLSAKELDFSKLLLGCGESGAYLQNTLRLIADELSKIISNPCRLEFSSSSLIDKPKFSGALFAATWPIYAGQAWLELDTKTIQSIVYAAIGQKIGQSELDPRLSDLEHGVAMFLFARVFEASKESFALIEDPQVPAGPLLGINLSLKINDSNSFVRVWVSKELVSSLSRPNDSKDTILNRTNFAQVPINFELSKLEISEADLKDLEVGDILVLENNIINFQEGTLSGEIVAQVGEPNFGSLKCALKINDAGNYQATVTEINTAREP